MILLHRLATTVLATLAGLRLGCLLREQLTGRPAQWLRFDYVDEDGRHFKSVPVSSKLYPALLFARLGQPSPLFGAIGGLIAGLLMDDAYEAALLRWILARSPGVRRPPARPPAGKTGPELAEPTESA
jgi:hypothetical protein